MPESNDRLQKLTDERAGIIKQAQELHATANEDGKWGSEDRTQFERHMARAKELRETIERETSDAEALRAENEFNEAQERRAVASRRRVGPDAGIETPTGEIGESPEERDARYMRATDAYVRYGADGMRRDPGMTEEWDTLKEMRATAVSTTAGSGGATIPEGFVASVRLAKKAFGGIRQVAMVVNTPSGNDLPWPQLDDTGNSGQWVGEGSTATGAVPAISYGNVTLKAHKGQSGPIKLSREILQDSGVDVLGILADRMGERLGRLESAAFVSGNGTGKPLGVQSASTGATNYIASAGSSNLTFDVFKTLKYSIDPAYMGGSDVRWMFNNSVMEHISKLTDGNSHYYFQPSLTLGEPDTLLGHGIVINQDMANSTTAGSKPVFFGDWKSYAIRDVAGMDIVRLDEKYALEGNVGFIGFQRVDGRSIAPSTAPARRPLRCVVATTA